MAPPMFHFAIVGAQRGFSSSVLLVLGGAFVYLFNVVLVARLDVFHLQSCWCSTGLLFIGLMSCWWLDSIYSIFSPVGARREFRALLILLWLGFSELFVFLCGLDFPSYLYFAVAWSSELFVFRCGLDFRAICISLWLGYPSPCFMVVARLNLCL